MEVLSINVSKPKNVSNGKREFSTGIYKEPITGRVMVRELNIDGDEQADLVAHGGPYKAVYTYSFDHYPYWQEELGRELAHGTFGENLTITGGIETEVNVGDIFKVGGAVLQATQPRVPCFKLAHKVGEPTFVKSFMQANRTGFYLRVLGEGEIGVGDTMERTHVDPEGISIHALFHLLYVDSSDKAMAERALKIDALPPGWHGSMEDILAK